MSKCSHRNAFSAGRYTLKDRPNFAVRTFGGRNQESKRDVSCLRASCSFCFAFAEKSSFFVLSASTYHSLPLVYVPLLACLLPFSLGCSLLRHGSSSLYCQIADNNQCYPIVILLLIVCLSIYLVQIWRLFFGLFFSSEIDKT